MQRTAVDRPTAQGTDADPTVLIPWSRGGRKCHEHLLVLEHGPVHARRLGGRDDCALDTPGDRVAPALFFSWPIDDWSAGMSIYWLAAAVLLMFALAVSLMAT